MGLSDYLQLGGTFDNTASGLWGIMKWVLILAILGLVFWWMYNRKQYKYEVKLKVFSNDQFVYFESPAKLVMIDGSPYWYIKKLKHNATAPPSVSQTHATNGKWIGEGYYDRQAGVIWSRDTMNKAELARVIEEMKRKGDRSGTGVADTHYQPMSTTERSLQAGQVTKAVLRKGKNIWDTIWQMLPAILIVIMIALILIYWNDLAKPLLQMSQENQQITADQKVLQEQNIRLYMMLTGGKGNGTNYVIQAIPANQQYQPFAPAFPGVNST